MSKKYKFMKHTEFCGEDGDCAACPKNAVNIFLTKFK
jgi:hypothetical protein